MRCGEARAQVSQHPPVRLLWLILANGLQYLAVTLQRFLGSAWNQEESLNRVARELEEELVKLKQDPVAGYTGDGQVELDVLLHPASP